MNVEYHRWWSPSLDRDMELKVYGSGGRPVIVFPCQGGRFHEFEDFGMLPVVAPFVEAGRYTFYTIDSVDNESWGNTAAHPADRGRRHEQFDRYVVTEAVPFVRGRHGGAMAVTYGCSMGGYHAANFLFRHPDCFDGTICLSGLFSLDYFVGDYMDETVYLNWPLRYLPNLNDPWFLERLRRSRVIVCVGQGAWEERMLADARALGPILEAKGIPHWIDIWGHDVNHDWPWWRIMLPYFLEKMGE